MHTRAEQVLQDLVDAAVTMYKFSEAARHTLQQALDALAQVLRLCHEAGFHAAAIHSWAFLHFSAPGCMRQAAPDSPHAEVLELLGRFRQRYSLAEAYSAYQLIHAAASAPFSTALPSTLFHASHFLLARLMQVALH